MRPSGLSPWKPSGVSVVTTMISARLFVPARLKPESYVAAARCVSRHPGESPRLLFAEQAVDVHLHAAPDDERFCNAQRLVDPGVSLVVGLERHRQRHAEGATVRV